MDLKKGFDSGRAFLGRLLLSDGLRARTVRGGAWLGVGSVAEQAVRFGRNVLLARMLAPGAFGTMAIVISSASLIDTLTDVGQKGAIIQNPRGGEDAYLNASWWLGMGRAIFSYLLIFSLAPWVSHFYERPELSALLRVTLLGILFNGAMSPRSILAQKDLKLARWAFLSNGGGICGVILTVVLSFFIRDVWALAIGNCSEQAFRCFLSYALCPGMPTRRWDMRAAREILTYSRGIFGLGFFNLIIARTDIFVLARLYPSAALGFYTMAVALVTTPSTFLTALMGQSLLPAMSSIQDDVERLNRILVEVTSWLSILGLPITVFVCLCAPYLLRIAYGSRYDAGAGPLSVASIVVLLTILNAALSCVLFAKGRPGVHRHAVVATAAAIVLAIYPACKLFGPVGGQFAALTALMIGYLFQLIRVRGVTGLNLLRYARVFAPAAMGSGAMLVIILASRHIDFATGPVAQIALCAATCLGTCSVCAWAHWRASKGQNRPYSQRTPESAAVL